MLTVDATMTYLKNHDFKENEFVSSELYRTNRSNHRDAIAKQACSCNNLGARLHDSTAKKSINDNQFFRTTDSKATNF